ncbi:MAG: NADH-quinone oxidoreductase subunit C [Alphaproteobacteria bacterium]|nr:NADH-quinone oxidoreductase subunit C [Alphaproteobacteria bacterium]
MLEKPWIVEQQNRLREISQQLQKQIPSIEIKWPLGELTVTVHKEHLVDVVRFLGEEQGGLFNQLIDICGVDYLSRPKRFELVYHLLSLRHSLRVRLKLLLTNQEAAPSLVAIFPNAGWYEREAWDLYGIPFLGNPDLRRILTDYGFEGHPLRKDFPLTGHVEVRYDELQKKVLYEPVKLSQEFRRFDFLSPWEGILQLPGDEKAKGTKP